MHKPFIPARHALARAALSLFALPLAAAAQGTSPTSTVVVTGNPLGRDTLAQPTSVLAGEGLVVRRGGTLGETLDGLPGVASTSFGPQSSRPVIRGLDGDRVRLLDNGGASVDASNLSFDHAVALDPLVAERIEILRGPAALLYGGNATGGVVNLIDNRIPRAAADGLSGRAELRLGGAAREKAGAALLEGGAGGFSWHADVAGRNSDDLRTPRFQRPTEEGGSERARRVANSAGQSRSGALGASWADADGFIGASVDRHENDYGVTVEPDVGIRMERDRVALAGERRRLAGPSPSWSSRPATPATSTRKWKAAARSAPPSAAPATSCGCRRGMRRWARSPASSACRPSGWTSPPWARKPSCPTPAPGRWPCS